MSTTPVPVGLAGGLLALSLALIGCGDATTAPATTAPAGAAAAGSAPAPAAGAPFTAADVEFAQTMIPHHREAVQMAELAADRAQNPEVRSLAEQIRTAQQPEITRLTGFLAAWGAEVPGDGSPTGMHHGGTGGTSGMPAMPGAMTAEQGEQLRNATGAAFDRMFLTMMIEHHRGAVTMARREVEQGGNPDAKQMAEKIAADQDAEIRRMQQLQNG